MENISVNLIIMIIAGDLEPSIAFDLSHFKPNEPYLFEILSISLGLNNDIGSHSFETSGKVLLVNVWLDGELLVDNTNKC